MKKQTWVYLHRDGRPTRMMHRTARASWEHAIDDKADCEVCTPKPKTRRKRERTPKRVSDLQDPGDRGPAGAA